MVLGQAQVRSQNFSIHLPNEWQGHKYMGQHLIPTQQQDAGIGSRTRTQTRTLIWRVGVPSSVTLAVPVACTKPSWVNFISYACAECTYHFRQFIGGSSRFISLQRTYLCLQCTFYISVHQRDLCIIFMYFFFQIYLSV